MAVSRVCRPAVFKCLLFTACLVIAQVLRAESPAEAFAASGAVDPDACSVVILDLATGNVTDSHNADVPLIPASINKVVTIASLLEKSGDDFRYDTRIYAGGKIKSDGVVDGNIVVVGSGDPSLGVGVEPVGTDIIAECVEALRERGITCIRGDVAVDESIFTAPAVPPSWQQGDLGQAYGTGCHGLNYRRNASGSRSVADPAAMFADRLRAAITDAGIRLERCEDVPSRRGKLLLSHKSPPIDEIMRSCMMRSDNLYAEAFLRTLALLNGKKGDTDQGTQCEADYWKRKLMPMQGVTIIDGSGLSRSNRMTALFMARVLEYMSGNAWFASFFPLAGQEGTLRKFLKDTPLDSYMALKTGSMNGIQCYAGYLLDDDYVPTHVVVVMVNGFRTGRAAVKKAVADMLLATFRSDVNAG